MNNPFETYPETIASIYRKRHVCPTRWAYAEENVRANGEVEPDARLEEYWINEECAYGYCEYCYGHRYNEWFIDKPTETEIKDMILREQIKCDLAKKQKKKHYNEILHSGAGNNGQLITLCIDKAYIQIPKLCGDIIAAIRKANYSVLCDATAVIEIHGKDGNYNPHLHLATKKIKNAGVVSQVFRRKFQNQKYQIYRVDVKDLPYQAASDYVEGIKIGQGSEAGNDLYGEDEQIISGKMAAVDLDIAYRNKHALQHIYEI